METRTNTSNWALLTPGGKNVLSPRRRNWEECGCLTPSPSFTSAFLHKGNNRRAFPHMMQECAHCILQLCWGLIISMYTFVLCKLTSNISCGPDSPGYYICHVLSPISWPNYGCLNFPQDKWSIYLPTMSAAVNMGNSGVLPCKIKTILVHFMSLPLLTHYALRTGSSAETESRVISMFGKFYIQICCFTSSMTLWAGLRTYIWIHAIIKQRTVF